MDEFFEYPVDPDAEPSHEELESIFLGKNGESNRVHPNFREVFTIIRLGSLVYIKFNVFVYVH